MLRSVKLTTLCESTEIELTIKAENDLLQSQGEVGRSEEALQVLSMKMTKSMMEQEKGFENLGSTLKKYGGELDNLDETSVDSTEALTNI